MKEILTSVGLGLNFLGTILLAFPVLRFKMWLKDDFISESGRNSKGEFWYKRRGFKRIKYFVLAGLGMLTLGFVLQFIAQFLSK